MPSEPAANRFRFGDFELDVAAFQLRRDGVAVRLERRPMELLVLLVTRHGQLVTREEIVELLWPQRVVIDFDGALHTLASKVRQALQDSHKHPRFVENVPGKGYRFIAAVTEVDAARPPHRLWWAAVVVVALAVAAGVLAWYGQQFRDDSRTAGPPPATVAQKSIAVLPFADLSEGQDQQYFSDGLAEEVLNLLAQSKQLRVMARTSSFSFRNKESDVATVARQLDVTHVLEGSVRKSGERLRVTAQLIDAASSSHLWSQTYDRPVADMLDVQLDIATSVAKALQVALGVNGTASAAVTGPAWDHFMRARYFHSRRAPGDLDRARENFEQAIGIDPTFARAWAGLAGTSWVQTMIGELPEETGIAKTRDAAERALALDPTLAEAHLRLGNVAWWMKDLAASSAHFRKAKELEPDHPLVLSHAAFRAARKGQFMQAAEYQRLALATDPMSMIHRDAAAFWLYYAGRLDEARDEWIRLLELHPDATPPGLGQVLVLQRRFPEAMTRVESWSDGAQRRQCLALIYHGLGRKAESDAELAKMVELSADIDPFGIAEVHAFRGEANQAFEWLERAVSRGHRLPVPEQTTPLWLLPSSPLLRSLQDDPRWPRWVEAVRSRADLEHGPPD